MNKKRVIVIDLDDTIAKKVTRHHFDWTRVGEDAPIEYVLRILDAYQDSFPMVKRIILTARNEGYPNPLKQQPELTNYKTIGREQTEAWVAEHVGEVDRVIMKPAESFQKSPEFKVEEIQKLLDEGLDIEFIMDDNVAVIEAVKERFPFITILQIANH
jgi:hypothetical protein